MKIQKKLGTLALIITAGSLALPATAFAQDAASADPASSESMQSVAPKAKMHHMKKHHAKKHHYNKRCCYKSWKYCHMTKVCQIKPAHWWGLTWFPTSKECWWAKKMG